MRHLRLWLVSLSVRLFLSYLNLSDKDKTPETEAFLAEAWHNTGFRKYVAWRDSKLIYELAGGVGMSEKTRDDYIRLTGQRVENLAFASRCKTAFTEKQKHIAKIRNDATQKAERVATQ